MIYFVQAGRCGNIKIGYTSGSVKKRLAELQTGCPELLVLLGTLEGNEELEAELHERFQSLRVHGEWFRPHEDLLEYVTCLFGKSQHSPGLMELQVGASSRQTPVWMRAAFVDENGTVYAPAAASGNETQAVMACCFDGCGSLVRAHGHVYLSTRWLRLNYPDRNELWDLIESNVNQAASAR